LILDSVADTVGRRTEFIVNGLAEIVTPTGNPLQDLNDTYAQYITAADGAGEISINFLAAGPNDEANLNGIQLLALPTTPVPEPSTLPLLASAIGALLFCRWHRPRAPGKLESLGPVGD
jgi:hypothetical protein